MKRSTKQKKQKKEKKKSAASNSSSHFTFTIKTQPKEPKEDMDNAINPFSIANDQKRSKALKRAGKSNIITYSFTPSTAVSKSKERPEKKAKTDEAARASHFQKKIHGPKIATLFHYGFKTGPNTGGTPISTETKQETDDDDTTDEESG